MKKLIFIYIIISACFFKLYSQSTSENLQKYWYYRERLKNYVLVSSNFNEPGTNIPADRILNDTISWDDGNAAFNHYIAMLATEYKLLKIYGQDYSQTIKELYYALKSFERLDKTAESYYRSNHSQLSTDLNGFFIREDITKDFWRKYGRNGTNPYFNQSRNKRTLDPSNPESITDWEYEKSEDNTWHYLEAFSLVNSLVGSEYVDGTLIDFKKLIKDNVRRVIDDMKHNHMVHTIIWKISPPTHIKNNFAYEWYVENPVTNEPVELGSGLDGTMLYVSYGFVEAGNHILGENRYTPPHIAKALFKTLLSVPMSEIDLTLDVYNKIVPVIFTGYIDVELSISAPGYKRTVLDFVHDPPGAYTKDSWTTSLGNIGQDDYKIRSLCATGNISYQDGLSPYEILIKKQKESSVLKYEHFPLIWCVSNNDYSLISNENKSYIENLLNYAPECGPYYFAQGDDGGLWSSSSRLVWPEKLHGGCPTGEYNGLDYMLLHNLYWLSTISQYPSVINYNPGIFKSNSIVATNQINCSVPVELKNRTLKFSAGNSIKLKPGCKINPVNNERFIARVNTGIQTGFRKVSITGYNSCSNFVKSGNKKLINNIKGAFSDVVSGENEKKNLENLIHQLDNNVMIYPNPAEEELNVKIQGDINVKIVQVLNSMGTIVLVKDINTYGEIKIDISCITSGIYFVRVVDNNNQVYIKKLIVK